MPRLPILWCWMLVLSVLLAGCSDEQRTPADVHLGHYRYAVVTFNNHATLGERAEVVLGSQGLIILQADDPRLPNPELARNVLWCTLTMERWSTGMAVSMVVQDDQHRELFHSRGKKMTDFQSVDAAVMALAPYRAADAPAAPKPGTIVEF